jgi:hypothetical protein
VKWKKEKYYYGEVGKRRNTIKETWEKEKHYCGELETELWAIYVTRTRCGSVERIDVGLDILGDKLALHRSLI